MIRAALKLFALALCALACALPLSAQAAADSAELYARGLEAYRAPTPDLAEARASWTSALAQGGTAAARAQLCKSLGNVAFRQDRPLEAAAWFTAAVELAPRDGDAWRNLELARSKAGLEPADRGDFASTWNRLVHVQGAAEARWLALALAGLCALLLVLRTYVLGSAGNWPVRLAFAGALLALVPVVVRAREAGRDRLFVVSTAGASVASEPRATATKVALLPAGARAERLEELAGWTRVETDGGERGWVPSETVFALAR